MVSTARSVSVGHWSPAAGADREEPWRRFVAAAGPAGIHCDGRWLGVLGSAFGYTTYALEATDGGRTVGVLPLALVRSVLFGRFLVSLPYASWAGVVAEDDEAAAALIDRAVELADELDVRHLELRHEAERSHPALAHRMTSKVDMRLELSSSPDAVWKRLRSVVRTQVRKGRKQGFRIEWGGAELLGDFYRVFAENMRDLGTPVFSRRLFASILDHFPDQAELCVVRLEGKPAAAALAIHSPRITEVPSVSTRRRHRRTAVNSWMYWQLIERAVQRGQSVFDFGRSTIDSGTYTFKKKWGAEAVPLVWQYYVRKGSAADMRPENGKYRRMIDIWRRLPVALTRVIGPPIVRGIPS